MAENNENDLSYEELQQKVAVLEAQLAQRESGAAGESTAEVLPAKHRRRRVKYRIFCDVLASIMIAAATVVLITNYAYPVMKIYGSSMGTTVVDGDIVIAKKTTTLAYGDICAFNFGNRILCKRVIGLGGDVIEMDDEGTVFVNGEVLDEPYLNGKSVGDCNIEFPYTVPKDCYFVLGDNRRISLDSRNKVIGCVSEEQIVGRLVFCILPPPSFGKIG